MVFPFLLDILIRDRDAIFALTTNANPGTKGEAMKIRTTAAIAFLAALLVCAGTARISAQNISVDARVSYFYDSLQPFGDWVWNDAYGWCWSPADMPPGWRPYTDGQWVYTDDGWTWVADQPWGWACFHYGRWFFDADYGWMWVPGTVWAPCWVVWETGDDWIGWAPCPPQFVWQVGIGFTFTQVDIDNDIPPFGFCYVHDRDFTGQHVSRFIEHPMRNDLLRERMRLVVGNYIYERDQIVNRLPVMDRIERATGRPVRPARIVDADSYRDQLAGQDEIRVFRPRERMILSAQPRMVPRELSARPRPGFEGTDLRTLRQRHAVQLRSLQSDYQLQQRSLSREKRNELQKTPPGPARQQVEQKYQRQSKALDQHLDRESRVIQTRQKVEEEEVNPPGPGRNEGGREGEGGKGKGKRR